MQGHKSKHRYAILSHRWGFGEPIFQQMLKSEEQSIEEPPAGIRKLLEFCRVAATDYGCSYAWSDTCCIDKQSSSELEEAIRSMYRWYRSSDICVVYLGASSVLDDLKDDPWFKRGWTLQELLAPAKIKLYGKDWVPINPSRSIRNDKEDEFIRRTIEQVTGIPGDDLRLFHPSCDRVSEKMTWMAPRQTTRTEDIAYSLIGIFDITMPISYGEGAWAFHRFMEAVAQRCFDPGFFAWCGVPSPYSLALPGSPSCYKLDAARAGLLQLRGFEVSSEVRSGDPSYTMTKTGLQVKVLLVPIDESSPFTPIDTYVLPAKPKIAIPLTTPSMNLTPARLRSAKSGRSHALGVVNYHPVPGGRGSVSARSNYFCLPLSKHDSNPWRKERTECVVVLKCEGTLSGSVETIMLAHTTRLLSYFTS
jgi:hypothetical protein